MTSIALLNWRRPLQPDLLAFTAKLLGKWQSRAVGGAQIMHYILRVLGFMQTRNFNLTFPVCDALFGTSDLDRGLTGTLFNGNSRRYMRRDLLPSD